MPSSKVLEEGAAPSGFPQISPNARGKEGRISTYGAAAPDGNNALTCKDAELIERAVAVQRVLRHLTEIRL